VRELAGKTAVVTGGGSGIGRALALAAAAEGMNVAIADVEVDAARAVAAEVVAQKRHSLAAAVDVCDRGAVAAFARTVTEQLGGCDLLFNNAGVISPTVPVPEMNDADWDWVIDVDLRGAINALLAFLPGMVASGRPGHIVNTASFAGLAGAVPVVASYVTAKFGVVGLSECLALDLASTLVGVSVLCPGAVKTRILEAGRNRPERFGGPGVSEDLKGGAAFLDMEPSEVARLAVNAVKDGQFYILTHPATRQMLEPRLKAALADYDWCLAALKEMA
jgi:NAD(P)-dependent dehydrogenase (short-subunit alcohol dehydrogenase family)